MTSGWLGRLLPSALLVLSAVALTAHATTLRVASAFDPQTMDPHALALLYHTRVSVQIYEGLVDRDQQFKLEPALALSWQATGPTTWRFKLRPNVVFHDGTPFNADDAVFSIERAMAAPSQRAFQLKGVQAARKLDDLTLELTLDNPDAVLPEKMQQVAMMSKAWCLQHRVEKAQDFNAKQETYTVRNANGTGPYRLERFEPDVRTVLERNPRWWGRADRRSGNVDEVVLVPIQSDATRLAALVSGEVDLVFDPPAQDVARLRGESALKLQQGAGLGEQYLVFDVARDQLTDSDVQGRNPFKDLRVRRAVYQAINVDLIARKVLHGEAAPAGSMLSPLVDGSPAELDRRLPYDPARARALLAEAGYPDGFAVTLDCVNVAWRQAVCQAMTAMLAQAGIRASLRSSPTNQFFPKLSGATASFLEFGWTPTVDAYTSLSGLFHTWDKSGAGTFNAGRYSNPALDRLIDSIRVEPDLTRRRAMVGVALRMVGDDLPMIPLYRRALTWAMSKRVSVIQWPSDVSEMRWARIQ
jgi:peptide/nickel transport system substrate-binding protein